MELFNNLNLDEDEQDFIDSNPGKSHNTFNKSDNDLNQTMVTNFDDELE